jgi:hypothetical protein
VAAMLVVEGGVKATVEEGRRGGQWAGRAAAVLCTYFSPIYFLTVTATATEDQGNGAVSSHEAYLRRVILVAVVNVLMLILASQSLLSPSLFPSPLLISATVTIAAANCCLCLPPLLLLPLNNYNIKWRIMQV